MKKTFLKFLILLICVVLISLNKGGAFSAENIKVVDGDSLEMDGRRIRLLGIDAPEYKQYCFDAQKKKYDCGIEAKKYLKSLTEAPDFHCKKAKTDRYDRDLCICYAGEENVNLKMVAAGWAVPYRAEDAEYFDAARKAKAQKIGIYQGKYIAPELYRRLHKRKKVKN